MSFFKSQMFLSIVGGSNLLGSKLFQMIEGREVRTTWHKSCNCFSELYDGIEPALPALYHHKVTFVSIYPILYSTSSRVENGIYRNKTLL